MSSPEDRDIETGARLAPDPAPRSLRHPSTWGALSCDDLPLLTGSRSAGLPSGVLPRSSPRHARDRGQSTGAADNREHSDLALAEQLTEREVRVLQLLYGSLSRREIAAELGVSPNTIKTHTQAIYRKLGVFTRHDAITRGQDTGIL